MPMRGDGIPEWENLLVLGYLSAGSAFYFRDAGFQADYMRVNI
jgi:hypothetical protein